MSWIGDSQVNETCKLIFHSANVIFVNKKKKKRERGRVEERKEMERQKGRRKGACLNTCNQDTQF